MQLSAFRGLAGVLFLGGASGLRHGGAGVDVGGKAGGFARGGVHFIRIQKTGSTTFGDVLMREFCGVPRDDCKGTMHHDWSQATANGGYGGKVVTILRDPVERTISEFYWLRSSDGLISAPMPHWDFRNLTWLKAVQSEPNSTKALNIYLHQYRKNPSRNRQTLYLLGFRAGATGAKAFDVANPGATYDWDDHPGMLQRNAMAKLENLTAFGIAECWASSMRAMSKALGWNVTAVAQRAAATHERKQYKEGMARPGHEDPLLIIKDREVLKHALWGKVLPKKLVTEIEKWNNVDVKLYKAAKKRFSEKFGEPCD